MNLESIDEFLYLKTKYTLDAYFKYLKKGFDIIDIETAEIPAKKEHLILKYFGKEVLPYQVITTTFISETFHVVETYLKSNLLRTGEYLIYPSIDKYPEQKGKLENFNKRQKEEISSLLETFTKASIKKNKSRIEGLSKKIGAALFLEESEILVQSVTCSEALLRLEKYLNWAIDDEVKERFKLFIENRNEIIHFNKLTNLTFAASHSFFVLINLCNSNPSLYPKFSSLVEYVKKNLESYNILIQEILFATEVQKAITKVPEHLPTIIKKKLKSS